MNNMVKLEEFVESLTSAYGPEVRAEHLVADLPGEVDLEGYYLEMASEDAAEIEIWLGAGGWIVTIADAYQGEWPLRDAADLFDFLWSVTLQGAAVLKQGSRYTFATGSPTGRGSRRAHTVREWSPWGVPRGMPPTPRAFEFRISRYAPSSS